MPAPTLYDQRAQAVSEARQILDRADRAGRELSGDEEAHWDRINDRIDELNAEITKRERAAAATKSRPAVAPSKGGDGASLSITFPGYKVGDLLRGRDERTIVLSPQRLNPEHRKRNEEAYKRQFLGYLATGRESLGLQVGKDTKGGYAAPFELVADLIQFLDNAVIMRQLATVLPPMATAVNIGVPTWDTDPGDADWTAEVPASSISEDDDATMGQREFMPHLLTKLVLISLKLMRSGVIDVWGLIKQRLGYVFSITEEQAFLTGSGAQRPLGVFTTSADGLPASRNVTASATTSWSGDDLINTFYNVKDQYQKNGSWIMSRQAARNTRRLKTGDGQYLWVAGFAGQPNTILDRPLFQSEYANSTFTTGLYVAAFGDFKAGYMIADTLDFTLQELNELFARTNQVGIIGRKETDGTVVLPEALTRLILA